MADTEHEPVPTGGIKSEITYVKLVRKTPEGVVLEERRIDFPPEKADGDNR